MNRIEIINSLIEKNNYKSYLEIGVEKGLCFKEIKCDRKIGVDPNRMSFATRYMTSDDFFKSNTDKFDICFSDGLHHSDQSEKDILNMLDCLEEGGTIVVHDNLPIDKWMQEIPLTNQYAWTGNVWRTWVKLRATRPDLEMRCIDTDWGTSIVRKGKQDVIVLDKPIEEITYEDFVENKKYWMNIISVEEFKQLYL